MISTMNDLIHHVGVHIAHSGPVKELDKQFVEQVENIKNS